MNIPKGVETGLNLRMNKKGNQSTKGEAGDLLIKISVKDHPIFKREGYDIKIEKKITLTDAVLGKTITVDTLNGKT